MADLGGIVGRTPLQILADQLTLFKPEWADFDPHTIASPPSPPIQKAIYTSAGGSEFYSSPSVLRNKKHLLKKLGYLSGFFELISLKVRSKITIRWLWILVKQS